MKMLKALSHFFSQSGLLKVFIGLITFSFMAGFGTAVSVYNLRIKNPLTQYLPADLQQEQDQQKKTMNETSRQTPTVDIEEACKATNFSNMQSRKYQGDEYLPGQKENDHTNAGVRRR